MAELRLNLNSPALKGMNSGDDGLKDAVSKRMMHKEMYEEAWQRVLSMKNSARDQERLLEVKAYMDEGKIGRDPERANKKFAKVEALQLYEQIEEQKRKSMLRDMVENTPDNYELVTTDKQFSEMLQVLKNEELIVFDVETTGVDVWNDVIVGHVLTATSIDRHYYIPTDHKDATLPQLNRDYVAKHLRPIYEDESIKKIAHNAKFDMQMLANNFNIELRGLAWDTQEAMILLNENEPTYALKPLVSKYLRDKSYTYGQLFGDKGFDEVPLDEALAYAAKDGDVTYRLYEFQRYQMKKVGNIYEYFTEIEMPLMTIVSGMELMGYDIDVEYANKVADRLRKESEAIEKDIVTELNPYYWKTSGKDNDINIGSPAQLKKAIEGITEKEPKSSDKNTLKQLNREGYEVFGRILDYRDKRKLLTTYYEALPNLIQEKTGRVHTRFKQNGAKTGRFSSGGSGSFNIQNQSPEARRMFVAPPGKLIVNADFSAQEVRIIASLSQEEVLLEAFDKGVDAYATLASEFFNKPYEDVYKNPDGSDTEERSKMKVVLLMSMYGASKHGLAQALDITADEAEKFLEDFFNKYQKIARFIEETNDFAKKNGYVWIGDKHRKRRLPEARWSREFIPYGKWNDPKYAEAKRKNGLISGAMRQGPNARIQGLASIQTKVTMLEMAKLCERKGWEIFAPIHDEIVLYTYDNITEEDIKEIDHVMTQSFKLDGVENKSDIEVQRHWGDSVMAYDYLKGKNVHY